MAETMYFRVRAGVHNDQKTGEQTTKDGYVESDKPLDEMFVNKYERCHGPDQEKAKKHLSKKKGSRAATDENDSKWNARMPKENTIDTRSISTPSRGADNTDINKDDVVLPTNATEDADAREAANKEDSKKSAKKASKPAKDEEEDSDGEEEGGEGSELGEDVTSNFEDAEDKGLRVFKDGKRYFITTKDELDEPVSSRKGIDRKAKVEKFITNYKAEDDDDSEEE